MNLKRFKINVLNDYDKENLNQNDLKISILTICLLVKSQAYETSSGTKTIDNSEDEISIVIEDDILLNNNFDKKRRIFYKDLQRF